MAKRGPGGQPGNSDAAGHIVISAVIGPPGVP